MSVEKAYCFPTDTTAAENERDARWARSNPVELTKEIEMMERAGVKVAILHHARVTLEEMTEARNKVYRP